MFVRFRMNLSRNRFDGETNAWSILKAQKGCMVQVWGCKGITLTRHSIRMEIPKLIKYSKD